MALENEYRGNHFRIGVANDENGPHIYPPSPGKLPDGVRKIAGLKDPREAAAKL